MGTMYRILGVLFAFAVGLWGASYLPEDSKRFELTRSDGVLIDSQQALANQPYLITFGYTYCPDICPTTLAHVAAVLEAYPSPLQAVFVSVDPERDTLERLGQYAAYFDPSIWAVTGTTAQLDRLKGEYSIYFQKTQGPDYLVDHSAGVLVMDSQHRVRGVLQEGESVAQSLATLENVLGPSQ